MTEQPQHPIADYLRELPAPRRDAIAAIYQAARRLAPDATEGVKYAMPALVVDGQGLISVMSTKKHIGIYPFSGTVVHSFADRLDQLGVPCTKGAIQLPDDVRLPDELLAEIVRARLTEIAAKSPRGH